MIFIKIIKILTRLLLLCSVILFFLYIFPPFSTNQVQNSSSPSYFGIYQNEIEVHKMNYDKISEMVVPYIVKAKVQDIKLQTTFVGEIVEDVENGEKYHIKNEEIDEWYSKYFITILDVEDLHLPSLSDYQLELYLNMSFAESKTDYYLWVDLYRMQVYLFKKIEGYFFLEKRFLCSPGNNATPTKRGYFTIVDKGTHFYSRDATYLCYNWLKYSGSYLFHSFPYGFNNEVLDSRLQERVSNGCIRLSYEDSLYLYQNVPLKTTVWVN